MKTRASLISFLSTQDLWACDREVVFDLCRQIIHRSDLDWTATFTRQRADPGAPGPIRVIPVYGMLEQRSSILDEFFGTTSYQGVRDAFRAALRDPGTRAIVLDIDSPGGTATGTTELASEIRAARGGRVRIVSSISGLGASAAYWLASQADEVVASPSSTVGSIGIIAVHQEISRALEAEGITTTIFATPAAKSEGNPLEPLTDEAKAAILERQSALYASFVSDVAKGRRTTIDNVRANYGEGRAWLAGKALAAGMIDHVETIDDTVARLQQTIGARGAGRMGAASDWIDFGATAIAYRKTDTSAEPWDGSAEEAKIANDAGAEVLREFYAWNDPEADPDTKDAYKFDHHFASADGTAGPASTVACSSGCGYLNRKPGSTGYPNIPDGDRRGVFNHLAEHLRDAGMEPPMMMGALPFGERVLALAAEGVDLAGHARERARLRGKEGRPAFSTSTEAALRATRDALDEILSGDPGQASVTPPVEPAPSSGAEAPTPQALPPITREEFLSRLTKGVQP